MMSPMLGNGKSLMVGSPLNVNFENVFSGGADLYVSANNEYWYYFTDDNGVIIVGGIYFPDEKKANSNDACFTAKLDENGMFTELTPLT